MGISLLSLTLILLSSPLFPSTKSRAQAIKSSHLLDLIIRDYTLKSFNTNLPTGSTISINLPSNFSGIRVNTAKFRCGSLRRYGATFQDFQLGTGVEIQPCVERLVIVTQYLGHNWSTLYYQNYDLSGYQLVSPVLGLLAYNAGSDVNTSAPFELAILAREGHPINVHFPNGSTQNTSSTTPLCASFERDGKVRLAKQAKPNLCAVGRNGHFGLVTEEPASVQPPKRTEKPWRVALGSSIGAALGAFLIGLLLVAMLVRVKKRSMIDELERRAYEEEALQVSMVGHIRAPTACGTRTAPSSLDRDYLPPPPPR